MSHFPLVHPLIRKEKKNNNNQKLKEKKMEKILNYHKWPLTDL